MKDIERFISDNGLTMTCKKVDHNPNMIMQAQDWPATHWKCTIKKDKKRLNVFFSMGIGHGESEPQLPDVLDCLAQDAATCDNAGGFEDWAAELGYDTDSRKALKSFEITGRESAKLMVFLGQADYDALLWDTERL